MNTKTTTRVAFSDIRRDLRDSWSLPTQREACPPEFGEDGLPNEAHEPWEQADDDMVEAFGEAVELVASGMADVEVLVTSDAAEAHDFTRGQDPDEARRVWQAIHDEIGADSSEDGSWEVQTTGYHVIGGVGG